jgi:hypothetical protein
MLVLDIAALALDDYSFRLKREKAHTLRNTLSFNLELAANIFFSIEVFIGFLSLGVILEPNTYLRGKWRFFNFFIVASR